MAARKALIVTDRCLRRQSDNNNRMLMRAGTAKDPMVFRQWSAQAQEMRPIAFGRGSHNSAASTRLGCWPRQTMARDVETTDNHMISLFV